MLILAFSLGTMTHVIFNCPPHLVQLHWPFNREVIVCQVSIHEGITRPVQVIQLCRNVLLQHPVFVWKEWAPLELWRTRPVLCAADVSGCVTHQTVIHWNASSGRGAVYCDGDYEFLTGKLWQARRTECCLEQSGGVEICCRWAVWGHITATDTNNQLEACRHNMWQMNPKK